MSQLPCEKGTQFAAAPLLSDGADDDLRSARVGRSAAEDGAMTPARGRVWRAVPLVVVVLVALAPLYSLRVASVWRSQAFRGRGHASAALGSAAGTPDEASRASSSSFLVKREPPSVPPPDRLREQNGQDRPRERFGRKQDGFVHLLDHTAEERRQEMTYLQQVRRDAGRCGGDMKSTWKRHTEEYSYSHAKNAIEFKDKKSTGLPVQRYSCDAPHPQHYDSDRLQVHIERLGPFHSTGNGDWSTFDNYPEGTQEDTPEDYPEDTQEDTPEDRDDPPDDRLVMREQILAHKDVYVRGSFVSIVEEGGDFFSYPPLHMHHLHLHPYHGEYATRDHILPKKTNGTSPDDDVVIVGGGAACMDHHIIAQQHGDSLCHVGGVDDFSCLLHLFPLGHGMRVKDSQGFRLDFQVNDFRAPDVQGEDIPEELEPLEFYVEVAILWTPKPQVPVTYLQVSAPMSGGGPATYAVPIDDSSSMIYYNYTHDWRDDDHLPAWDPQDERLAAGVRGVPGLGAGIVTNVVGHVHQNVFDSLFIFKESNHSRKVFEAIDTLRPKDHYLPYLPECHGTTLEQTKVLMTDLAMRRGGGELVCEVTKPGLVWTQTPSGSVASRADEKRTTAPASYAYRDRLMDLHCREDLRLEPGDTLTFVSFSKSRPTSTLGHIRRGSFLHQAVGIFEEGFAQSEHTIMRFDFVSDRARTAATVGGARITAASKALYAPPSMYLTQRWSDGAPDEACLNAMCGKQWFSFVNKNIQGWDVIPDDFVKDFRGVDCGNDAVVVRLSSMLDQCPASISMNGTKPAKDSIHSEVQ